MAGHAWLIHKNKAAFPLANVVDWVENNLAFPNLKGGYMHPKRMGEAFRELLKESGLPHMRFHDLRHSAATILLAMKVHPKVVQEILVVSPV